MLKGSVRLKSKNEVGKVRIIYKPDGFADWANSHAMIPTPVIIDKETVRVYTTFCDKNGIGRPGYVDLDSSNLKNIKKVSSKPLLEIGLPGSFDDNGILTCSVVDLGDGVFYMYYAGFELCNRIRYRLLTGLAVSQDGGETFARYSNTPILERSSNEMYFRGGPFCKRKEIYLRCGMLQVEDGLKFLENRCQNTIFDI